MNADIGQLLWVGFEGPTVTAELGAALASGDVGGTVVFKRNLVQRMQAGTGVLPQETTDLDALAELTRGLHRSAPDGTPALIAIDQEGGVVQRVKAPATQWPPMHQFERFAPPADEELAHAVGKAIAAELRALDFDVDFAPVLDVHTNAANPIIGDRAFGTEPAAVARRALAFVRGMTEAGVVACGKHFPGHGDTHTDSHLELPWVRQPKERLEAIELAPFAAAAHAQVPMMMTAHVMYPALDPDVPATLSKPIIDGVLRQRFGYRGIIVSDDLDMAAVAVRGADNVAPAAIKAGCDLVLVCRNAANIGLAREGLAKAAETDSELRRRIGESAARIRAFKAAFAKQRASLPPATREIIGSFDHRRLADRLAGR